MFKSYEIDKSKIDKPTFFKFLAKYFSDATTFYGGGSGLPVDVRATYETHEDEGMYVPPSQTEWRYRCVFSQALMEDLAGLSEKHNLGEILKHLFLYKGKEPLLLWHNVLIDTRVSISDSVPEETVSEFAEELGLEYLGLTKDDCCVCVRLPDIAVILMGDYRIYWEVCETLEEAKSREEPYWWLSIKKCSVCGQRWLVAQEERINDVLCLRRLNSIEVQEVLDHNHWPPDFDKYETLLRLGREAGVTVTWILSLPNRCLPATVADLARERPGIRISEIADLLSIDISFATDIAKKVINEEGVQIDFKN